MSQRIPDRGDVFWLEFHPQRGREQRGRRPAVVLSPASYNGKVGLAAGREDKAAAYESLMENLDRRIKTGGRKLTRDEMNER